MRSGEGPRETVRVARAWRALVRSRADLLAIAAAGRVVHDTPRSLVVVADTPAGPLVVKRSRRQERSRWLQATGWWRHGEGVRAFDLLARLAADGLPVPEPVAAADTRRGGFVVASWLAYRLVEGTPGTCEDAPAVARVLARMHALGWVHRDPHVRNFLRSDDRLVLLDVVSVRRRHSSWARAYDYALLEKCCPRWRADAAGVPVAASWLRLARVGCRAMVAWRALKRRVRSAGRHDAPPA